MTGIAPKWTLIRPLSKSDINNVEANAFIEKLVKFLSAYSLTVEEKQTQTIDILIESLNLICVYASEDSWKILYTGARQKKGKSELTSCFNLQDKNK